MNLTLLGQMGTFAVLVFVIWRFLWDPITQALEERTKRVADGLAAAEKGKHELELAEKRAGDVLRDAKLQVSDIVAHAERRASEIVDAARHEAKQEAERIVIAAKAEVDQERNRAREDLRASVADLVVYGASKILEKEIDAKAHAKLLADAAKQL
ncbi:MAG: F0F1 ATP synthase subunit B [Gammaproteobacteria bacterium]|jgi:F-type H+-transporting ATPase subunit b|nr:F0F1 ATP synthase subunit B [Gammaproteobacteria bacterium]